MDLKLYQTRGYRRKAHQYLASGAISCNTARVADSQHRASGRLRAASTGPLLTRAGTESWGHLMIYFFRRGESTRSYEVRLAEGGDGYEVVVMEDGATSIERFDTLDAVNGNLPASASNITTVTTTTVSVSAMTRTPNATLPRCSVRWMRRARERLTARWRS